MSPLTANSKEKLEAFLKLPGKFIIIGLGNEYKSDDAAGLVTAQILLESNRNENVNILEAGRNLLNHIGDIEARRPNQILIIDAADLGLAPGEWMTIEPGQIREHGLSTHENNLPLTMEYLRRTLPDVKIMFLGIQFGSLEMREELALTEKIKEGVDEIANQILDVLKV